MPFTKVEDRLNAIKGTIRAVGDRCFLAYLRLVQEWRQERRWTTAHNQYKDVFGKTDEQAARELAYLVHFIKNVMEYEAEKEKENGTI